MIFGKNESNRLGNVSPSSHLHTGVYEPVFSKNTAFNKNFGTTGTTVAYGNHTHAIYAQTDASASFASGGFTTQLLGTYQNTRLGGNKAGAQGFGFISSESNMYISQNAYFNGAWKSYSNLNGKAAVIQTNLDGSKAISVRVDNSVTAANEGLILVEVFSVSTAGAVVASSTVTATNFIQS